jgi:hypothetical protein
LIFVDGEGQSIGSVTDQSPAKLAAKIEAVASGIPEPSEGGPTALIPVGIVLLLVVLIVARALSKK